MSIKSVSIASSFSVLFAAGILLPAWADQPDSHASTEGITSKPLPADKFVPKHSETNYSGWEIDTGKYKISCIDPHAACSDSEHVLDTLKILFTAYSKHDIATASEYMDADCTTFDEGTKTLITGRKAVLADLKQKLEQAETNTDSPLLSYTIEHPYAKVMGNTAVASFVAHRELGGEHPKKLEAHCTDIFVKEDGKWKLLHYRRSWKEV